MASRMMQRAGGRRIAAPFQVGGLSPFQLIRERFAAQVQVPGRRSSIARYSVARQAIVALQAGAAFRMRLKGQATGSFNSAAASVTIDLAAATEGLRIVPSPAGAAATYPTTDHPDVIVYRDSDGSRMTIEAVDYDANTVTVTNPAASTAINWTAYGQLQQGGVQLVAVAPASLDNTGEVVLFDGTLRGLHEVNQSESRTAPRIRASANDLLPLGPQWRLDIVVDTPATVVFNDAADHEVQLQAQSARVDGDLLAAGRHTAALLRR